MITHTQNKKLISYENTSWRSGQTKKQYTQFAAKITSLGVAWVNDEIISSSAKNLTTAQKKHAMAKHFLNYLKEKYGCKGLRKLIDVNSLIGVKKTIRDNQALNIAQRIQLANYLVTQPERTKFVITILSTTGMRADELVNLDLSNLAKRTKIIGKGNKERYIFLNNDVITMAAKVDKLSYITINRICKKIEKELFKDQIQFTPHTLRYSYATNLYNKGGSIEVISQLLGHEDIKTTLGYITFNLTRIESINDLQYMKYEDSYDLEELRVQNITLKKQVARLINENKELMGAIK